MLDAPVVRPRCLATLAALVAATWVFAAPGARAAPPAAERIEVRLVTVDVRVTDAAGRPIDGLAKEDFALFADGARVDVGAFAARPEAPAPSSAENATASPAEGALRVTFFLDGTLLSLGSRERARAGLLRALESPWTDHAEIALVTYDPGLHVRVPFTHQRERVAEALRALESMTPGLLTAEIERRVNLERIIDRQRVSLETPFDVPCPRDLGLLAEQQAEIEGQRARAALDALATYAKSMIALPGRKVVVWVTDGVPLVPGFEAYALANRLCDGSGAREGMAYAIDATSLELVPGRYDPRAGQLEAQGGALTRVVDTVAATASAQGVTIFALLARGAQRDLASAQDGTRHTSAETASAAAANLGDTLASLAQQTGGEAMLEHVDLDAAMAGVGADIEHGYTLGFYPERAGDDRRHTLRVEVSRPGARVRYRTTYRDAAPDTLAAEQVLGALLHGTQADTLGVQVSAISVLRGSGRPGVRLRVLVPFARLTMLDRESGSSGVFTLFIAVRRADGSITPVRSKTIPLGLAPIEGRSGGGEYRFETELELPPGEHLAAVAVRDDVGGALDVRTLRVRVKP